MTDETQSEPFWVTFDIDPKTLSTAQQKVMSWRTRRIITNPKVARAMKIVKKAAEPYAQKARKAVSSPNAPRRLVIKFTFQFPKEELKRKRKKYPEFYPATSLKCGDLDNRAKAFIDALVQAGWMPDDRFVTTLNLAKRYTYGMPKIDVSIQEDNIFQQVYNGL